jgi:cystathionine beta-synthase
VSLFPLLGESENPLVSRLNTCSGNVDDRYDFVPHVLDRSPECIDTWIKVNDEDAFGMVRKIMYVLPSLFTHIIRLHSSFVGNRQTESLLIGGSSGSALSGLYKFLTQHPDGKVLAQEEGKNVVVLLPDGVRNYISKVRLVLGLQSCVNCLS